jgi:hypothetical protein
LERGHVLSRRTLGVHCKPNRPNKYTRDARRYVLRDLQALLVCKLLDFDVVGLDLGLEHRAVRVCILRLHRGYRLRVAARTTHQRDAEHRDYQLVTHEIVPLQGYREIRLCSTVY